MALFEPLTVSIRGRVPTRLRRVARWRQGIAALHSVQAPRRMAKPFEWATRRSRVGTGDETPLPRRRQSDEKSAKPVSGKAPQNPPEVRMSEIGCNAFSNDKDVAGIIIPASVTEIKSSVLSRVAQG